MGMMLSRPVATKRSTTGRPTPVWSMARTGLPPLNGGLVSSLSVNSTTPGSAEPGADVYGVPTWKRRHQVCQFRDALGMAIQLQLRFPQRYQWCFVVAPQLVVEQAHQRCGGLIIHLPQTGDDRARAGDVEGALQTKDAFAASYFSQARLARR